MASLEELRKERTKKKTQVTKKVNELRRLVIEDNNSEVTAKFNSIKGVFNEFCVAHTNYHDKLKDEADISASDKYYEDVECKYIDGLQGVRDYIKGSTGASSSSVSYVKLPPVPQPDVFNGKPDQYPMWKAAFNTLVGKHNIGFDEKMFYLKQYTAGEAQSAIEALFLCPDQNSYESALDILEQRFGTPSLVTAAFRKKLESWPKIGEGDGRALQRFADFLEQICVAKKSYKSLEILSDEFENKKILNKLPAWLVNKWIEIVVNSVGKFPDFDAFTKFIKDKATIANHSLWSGQMSVSQSQKKQSQSGSQIQFQSHVAQVGQSQLPKRLKNCPVCGEGHKIVKCSVFSNMLLSDRKACIRDKNMCFGCLSHGHFSKDCRVRHICAVCNKKHPTLLHDYSLQSTLNANPQPCNAASSLQSSNVTQSNSNTNPQPCTAASTPDSNINLATEKMLNVTPSNRITTMIVPVMLRHPLSDKEILVYALLDTQSNTNFVTKEVVNLLNISGRRTSLDLTTMNGRMNVHTMAVDGMEVRGVTECSFMKIASCYVRDSIPCRREVIPTADMLEKWPHLSHVEIPPYYENAPIGLLIGYHCSAIMQPLEIATGGDDEPFGWKTSLGWCIVGVASDSASVCETDELGDTHFVRGCIAFRNECREVRFDVDRDFKVSMPVIDDKYSQEDVRFMELMSNKMFQRDDKHYEAPLPLKHDAPFPLNKSLALSRLSSLKSKFQKDPLYRQKYSTVMQEMLDNNFAEIIPDDEISPLGKTWYIPHHGVQQIDKLRVVFDCSSEFRGVCLNERLLQGPNLLNLLLGILFRFRLEPVALTCDIQKMYYQFRVSSGDTNLLRYLWWRDGDIGTQPVDCRMLVHLFGATSSPGVATYALRRIATDHGSKYSVEASRFVNRDFYVDDGVTSVSSVQSACDLIVETQKLLAEGGCRCHKVMSNSQEVMDSVPIEDRAPMSETNLHRTLGILWNVETDRFHFQLDVEGKSTRRGLLSTIAKIYDPLGVIAPLVHPAKLMLQQMVFEKQDWDHPFSDPMLRAYNKWCYNLHRLGEITVSCCIRQGKRMFSLEMHHFADACSSGYAACSYLRFLDEDGIVNVSFMIGKCKVAPLKPVLSIPRLELVAAVLSVQLASKLRKELPLQYTQYFWTDSTVVLGYIKNESTRFKVFVANRIQQIRDGSSPEQWYHVGSAENPADDGSRGVWSKRWLQGPDFLKAPELCMQEFSPSVSPNDQEVKCLVAQSNDSNELTEIPVLGTWFNTLKMWAWVLRFIYNCRGVNETGDLKVEEVEMAKRFIIFMVQRSCFAKEYERLSQNQAVSRCSPLFRLDVFLSGGLIRVGGRIRHSSLSVEMKHPVVLPSGHEVSMLIIQDIHNKTHHQGRGMTCSEVRSQGYWILSLQNLVKKLIRTCVICCRLRGSPIEQKMDRVSPCPPFLYSGCDLFGPFVVKSGRRECKRYGALFTCLVSRAVHIEVVHSLTTDSFLNAFRRFVALRGSVREIRCDQGTNMVGARNEMLKMGCDVIFNPPASSHRGGVWERMIGTARRIIEGILCEYGSRLDDEGLMTVLSEAASVINSRPLNVDNISDPQSLEPLTPNHLITMKSKIIPPNMAVLDMNRADLCATKQWRRVQYMIDLFWSRWKKEIVQHHMSRVKWNTPRQNLKCGDLVLVIDDQCHRSFWKLARITEAHTSQDGLVRSVKVQLADRSILQRPVKKLIRLLST